MNRRSFLSLLAGAGAMISAPARLAFGQSRHYTFDANGCVISPSMFRNVFNAVKRERISEIVINPFQMQKYEEQGFATQFVKLSFDAAAKFDSRPEIKIGGRTVRNDIHQSQNEVEFLGSKGELLGKIVGLKPPVSTKEFDHPGAIKGFIARKVEAGHKDLFLFKNRSGQWIYQAYDVSGNPTTMETFFLMYGKPSADGRTVLPRAGTASIVHGIPTACVEYDSHHTPSELRRKLEDAFTVLMLVD